MVPSAKRETERRAAHDASIAEWSLAHHWTVPTARFRNIENGKHPSLPFGRKLLSFASFSFDFEFQLTQKVYSFFMFLNNFET